MNSTNGALPRGFQPGMFDMIIGRGKRCYEHIGNKIFLKLIRSKLNEYSAASCKAEKTKILGSIVSEIKLRSPRGGFIKKNSNDGLYYQVEDFVAREKTSQSFRDALHDTYRSSNSSKKKARKTKKDTAPDVIRSTSYQLDQSTQSFKKQSSLLLESSKVVSDIESLSSELKSESESEPLQQLQQVEAFDDASLDQIHSCNIENLDLYNFEMDTKDCINLIQMEDIDCEDLMSTCGDEEGNQFEDYDIDSNDLSIELLFEDTLFENKSPQHFDLNSPILQMKEEEFFSVANMPKLICETRRKESRDTFGFTGFSLAPSRNTSAATTA